MKIRGSKTLLLQENFKPPVGLKGKVLKLILHFSLHKAQGLTTGFSLICSELLQKLQQSKHGPSPASTTGENGIRHTTNIQATSVITLTTSSIHLMLGKRYTERADPRLNITSWAFSLLKWGSANLAKKGQSPFDLSYWSYWTFVPTHWFQVTTLPNHCHFSWRRVVLLLRDWPQWRSSMFNTQLI